MPEINNSVAKRIEELESIAPLQTAAEDLEPFWDETLSRFSDKPLNAVREKTGTPLTYMDVYKVKYEGFDDTPISGWYVLPRFAANGGKLPCVVLFHGYAGSKGYPEDYSAYVLMGMAVFAVDIRGQGGETGNLMDQPFGVSKGWITQGILDKDTCYYKAIAVDALKALEWAAQQEEIDPARVCVRGASQGGGLALLAAALSDKPAIAVADIPNMCQMDFGILNSTGSLTEAAAFVERHPEHLDTVLRTLSYFDNVNLAHRIRIPVLVSCGLKDTVTMPETIYAAYNRITAPKEMCVYPFTGHHVPPYQNRKALDFIASHF
jgi:cephalosporin-C deacetylase